MLFSNKHVIMALIVGPVLAILAWIGVGQIAGEKPAVAQQGKSYPLVEKSDCRYPSGHCKLENEDFKLQLHWERRGPDNVLVLVAEHALAGVMLSVAQPGGDTRPRAMQSMAPGNREWQISMQHVPDVAERLHLVASSGGSRYFADAATVFIKRPE